jgi:ABC-type sugar transport system ATPase subunit
VLGKSGSGKSTLLKCIYGLVDLPSGKVLFNEEQVLGPAYNLIPGHGDMKLVSQEYYVLENHTVRENITDMLAGYTDDYKAQRSQQVLKAVELTKFADKKAKELSSGQRQRLSIARALAEFPKLLLLDEPFSNLDFARRDSLFTFIRENLQQHKASCIFVTHHAQEAIRYADQVLVMDEGKRKALDTPEKLYRHPETLEMAKLFGKCFLLGKKDFIQHKGLRFKDEEVMLRPEHFRIVSNANKKRQLTGTVQQSFFAGAFYELKIKLSSGKIIFCYSAADKHKTGTEISLIVE